MNRNRNAFICLFVVAALAAGAAPALARGRDDSASAQRDAIRRTITRDLAGGGRSVSVAGAIETLTVRPSTDGRVHVVATMSFWSNVEEFMRRVEDEFEVGIREGSDSIAIDVELPELDAKRRGRVTINYEIKLDVTVPEGTPLDIDNRYGKVDVSDVRGPARVTNTSGAIEFHGARGDVRLQSSYGDIVVGEIEGGLEARSASGAMRVRQVSGDARLSGQYGDVEVDTVGGRLEVRGASGAITAQHVGGDARLATSYADVTVEDVKGSLEVDVDSGGIVAHDVARSARLTSSYSSVEALRIRGDLAVVSSSGSATIDDVGGKVDVRGSYGDASVHQTGGPTTIEVGSGNVTASDIGGDLTIKASYGAVRVSTVKGTLTVGASSSAVDAAHVAGGVAVETTYGGVDIQGVGGAVTVRNASGAVTVGGLSGAALGAKHEIHTTYADVKLEWPSSAGVTFDLEATYGSVRSALPGTLSENGSRRTFRGRSGDGGATLTVVADSGSVILRTQ